MRFAVLGTCIGGDIIEKAKEYGWQNVSNNVSYSPFALGFGVHIIKGSIGNGSIIGTGSFVNSDIDKNVIAVGRSARVVRDKVIWSRRNDIIDIKQDTEISEDFTMNIAFEGINGENE